MTINNGTPEPAKSTVNDCVPTGTTPLWLKSVSENYEGCCFRGKGRMARRDEGEYPRWDLRLRSNEARRPSPRTLRAAGLFCPWPALTRLAQAARCGDAPASPPWPRPKSLAAAPFRIFRQALKSPDLLPLQTKTHCNFLATA